MKTNHVKRRLLNDEPVVGLFVSFPRAELVEMAGYAGFDFCVVDAEHSTIREEDCLHMSMAADAVGISCIVRVGTNEPQTILRYMDQGPHGAQIPQINSAEEARQAVSSVLYPPVGRRGFATNRPSSYGLAETVDSYVHAANQELLMVVQVETRTGLEQLPRILEVPGIDVIFIGPADLSLSLGYPGQIDHPEVQRAIGEAAKIVRDSGRIAGTMAPTPDQIPRLLDQGYRYITAADRRLIARAFREYAHSAQEACRSAIKR